MNLNKQGIHSSGKNVGLEISTESGKLRLESTKKKKKSHPTNKGITLMQSLAKPSHFYRNPPIHHDTILDLLQVDVIKPIQANESNLETTAKATETTRIRSRNSSITTDIHHSRLKRETIEIRHSDHLPSGVRYRSVISDDEIEESDDELMRVTSNRTAGRPLSTHIKHPMDINPNINLPLEIHPSNIIKHIFDESKKRQQIDQTMKPHVKVGHIYSVGNKGNDPSHTSDSLTVESIHKESSQQDRKDTEDGYGMNYSEIDRLKRLPSMTDESVARSMDHEITPSFTPSVGSPTGILSDKIGFGMAKLREKGFLSSTEGSIDSHELHIKSHDILNHYRSNLAIQHDRLNQSENRDSPREESPRLNDSPRQEDSSSPRDESEQDSLSNLISEMMISEVEEMEDNCSSLKESIDNTSESRLLTSESCQEPSDPSSHTFDLEQNNNKENDDADVVGGSYYPLAIPKTPASFIVPIKEFSYSEFSLRKTKPNSKALSLKLIKPFNNNNSSNNNNSNSSITTGQNILCSKCCKIGQFWCQKCNLAYCSQCWGRIAHHRQLDVGNILASTYPSNQIQPSFVNSPHSNQNSYQNSRLKPSLPSFLSNQSSKVEYSMFSVNNQSSMLEDIDILAGSEYNYNVNIPYDDNTTTRNLARPIKSGKLVGNNFIELMQNTLKNQKSLNDLMSSTGVPILSSNNQDRNGSRKDLYDTVGRSQRLAQRDKDVKQRKLFAMSQEERLRQKKYQYRNKRSTPPAYTLASGVSAIPIHRPRMNSIQLKGISKTLSLTDISPQDSYCQG